MLDYQNYLFLFDRLKSLYPQYGVRVTMNHFKGEGGYTVIVSHNGNTMTISNRSGDTVITVYEHEIPYEMVIGDKIERVSIAMDDSLLIESSSYGTHTNIALSSTESEKFRTKIDMGLIFEGKSNVREWDEDDF